MDKEERIKFVSSMQSEIFSEKISQSSEILLKYALDEDTYIRKNTYQILGRTYILDISLRDEINAKIDYLLSHKEEFARQTGINTVGEIGMVIPEFAFPFLLDGLEDSSARVRNAVMGSLKKIGEKKPKQTIQFISQYLPQFDPVGRTKLLHGLELHGRKHPEDILPLLYKYQNDSSHKVQEMIVHILSQISYKKGCLEKTLKHLQSWNNTGLIKKSLQKIIDTHKKYEKFSAEDVYTAIQTCNRYFPDFF